MLSESASIGLQARLSGQAAEDLVNQQLVQGGFTTSQSPILDYAKKTDVLATCNYGTVTPVQVSTSPKSARQQRKLHERGILPIATSELERTGSSAAAFICSNCVDKRCI